LTHLLDTQACVSILRGNPLAQARMAAHSPSDLGVSTVTIFELFSGVAACRQPARERARVNLFLSPLVCIPLDRTAAVASASLRHFLEKLGRKIGPYDLLIAGQAVSLGLTLVTDNRREFSRIPSLRIESWDQ
jgi:tRNA(fMet)-specific endonuclease VapC